VFDTYARIFDLRAGDYHRAIKRSPKAREAEFEAVLEPLRDASPGLVYDMPSGAGWLADYVPTGFAYLGVNPAPEFFVDWPEQLPKVLAEITNVPLTEGSADYVVSLAGLHHEPSLPDVFREMRRLLRTGGRVVLADVAVGTPPARFLNGFVNEHCPTGHVGRFLDELTGPALRMAGFKIADDRMIDVPWIFASFDEAGEFCCQLFGMNAVSVSETLDALEVELGFDVEDGRPRLRWVLRRIVADAV
jgi:SAM-dependent methyltransferase